MPFVTFLIGIVYILACIFLILVVLLQSGKGGGLSGMLGGAGGNPLTDTFGASGAEKTLSKWTTVAAVLFFTFSLLLTLMGGGLVKKGSLSEELKNSAAPAEATAPATPGEQPVEVSPGQEAPESPAPRESAPLSQDVEIPSEPESLPETPETSE